MSLLCLRHAGRWSMGVAGGPDQVIAFIENEIIDGLNECYPNVLPEGIVSVPEALLRVHRALGENFIVIIDEWDVLIRDQAENQKVQDEYIDFQREEVLQILCIFQSRDLQEVIR